MFFSVHATTQRIMAPAATSCHACGKSGCKLLRCGRCRNAWFCNRVCQVVAARQGHSGANCCPADKAPTPATEVTLRLPAAAGPSTTAPGVIPASLVSAATSCHACGKSAGRLLLCGRCRNAWFCNRECQVIARQELGHTGANCRSAAGVQQSFSADPSQVSTPADAAKLALCYRDLITEANEAQMTNTRIGLLAAVEKGREAASVTDLIGGAKGAFCRADTDQLISSWLTRLGDMAAAALAASSSLRAARASSNRTMLVIGLISCGKVATIAPGEMANAERASREQERINGYPVSYGGLDLSHEGRISLPTTPAALSRLGLAYNEAAVGICDANRESFPDVCTEAQARGSLGLCLYNLGEERQRSLELLRQAVGLRRQALLTAVPRQDFLSTSRDTLGAQQLLANTLSILGAVGYNHPSPELAEAEACLREALALGENLGDVLLKVKTLRYLINLCGEAGAAVRPAEAEALRSRLNQLLVQMGREPETSCSICLEPLTPPAASAAEEDAAGSGPSDSCVRVLNCNHQFHHGCLSTWKHMIGNGACPLCKK